MKTLFVIITCVSILLTSVHCGGYGDEDYRPQGYSGIISTNSTELSEIVFTLDLVYQDSLYLLADSLFSLELYLNNKKWGDFTSTIIDPSGFDALVVDNNLLSHEPVQYLFITNDQSGLDSLKTAGDYSLALRKLLSLQPGDYVAEIRYVSWKNQDNQTIRKSVRDLIPFTLDANVNSLYLGNFSSTIKL